MSPSTGSGTGSTGSGTGSTGSGTGSTGSGTGSTGSGTGSVGDVVAERTVHLTRESLVRYAGASGDFNQIHWSDVVAERVGLPGVLAHGMLTMGLAVTTLDAWVGDPRRILEYGVRFTRPVLVDQETGADVHVVAKVGAVSDDETRIDLTVTSADRTVLGKAQVRVAHA